MRVSGTFLYNMRSKSGEKGEIVSGMSAGLN